MIVTDSLPAQVTYVSDFSPDCVLTNGEVVCLFSSLPGPGGTSFTINVTVDDAGLISNIAAATTRDNDTNLMNNADAAAITGLVALIVTNTIQPNRVYTNDGAGTFRFQPNWVYTNVKIRKRSPLTVGRDMLNRLDENEKNQVK